MKKKILLGALVVGLIATPSVALARNGADDSAAHQTQDVRREDRRQNHNTVIRTNPASVTPVSNSMAAEQAKSIALARFPDKTIEKVEIENENGQVLQSVRFTDGTRVDVAQNGTIVREEVGTVKNNDSVTTPSRHGSDHDSDDDSDDDSEHDSDDDESDDDSDDNSGHGSNRR